MDVFHLRDQFAEDYREYVEIFIRIKDERIRSTVEGAIEGGLLWPAPLVQLKKFLYHGYPDGRGPVTFASRGWHLRECAA